MLTRTICATLMSVLLLAALHTTSVLGSPRTVAVDTGSKASTGEGVGWSKSTKPLILANTGYPQTPLPAGKILPPPTGTYAGLFLVPEGNEDIVRLVSQFEDKVGHHIPIVYDTETWSWETRNIDRVVSNAKALANRGTVYAIALGVDEDTYEGDPYIYQNFIDGAYDEEITQIANSIKKADVPIMITLQIEFDRGRIWDSFGEMGTQSIDEVDDISGLYGHPAWPDGPERFKDYSIHIIDIFKRGGVNNVTWFMYSIRPARPEEDIYAEWYEARGYFYPGDDYIDWVGFSIFPEDELELANRYSSKTTGIQAWKDMSTKPIVHSEFIVTTGENIFDDNPEADRTERIKAVFSKMQKRPKVKAFFWAEGIDSASFGYLFPSMVSLGQYHASEIEAWKEAVTNNPYFVKTPVISSDAPGSSPPFPIKNAGNDAVVDNTNDQ